MPACRDVPRQRVECYSFGAPRVGNSAWVAHFNRTVQQSWRFAKSENCDIESQPAIAGSFMHVKGAQRITFDTPGSLNKKMHISP